MNSRGRGRANRGPAGRVRRGPVGPVWWDGRREPGHRPPRRQRLPPRAHARQYELAIAHGRRLHRARRRRPPRTASSSRATRTRSAGTTDVADHPEFADRRTTKTIDGARADRLVHRGLHPRGARRRCAPGAPAGLRPAQHARTTAGSQIPTFDEVLDLARRAVPVARPAGRGLPRDQAPDVLPLHRTAAGGAAGRGAQAAPPGPARRRGVHAVLRDRQPARPRPDDQGAAGPALRRHRAPYDLVASGDPRTYADLATPAGLRQVARTPTGWAPTRTWCCRATRRARPTTPPALVHDAHAAGLIVTCGRSGARTGSCRCSTAAVTTWTPSRPGRRAEDVPRRAGMVRLLHRQPRHRLRGPGGDDPRAHLLRTCPGRRRGTSPRRRPTFAGRSSSTATLRT